MARPTFATLDPAVRDALLKAVREFNSWRFYDCHETLEDIWREAGGKSVEAETAGFYQGIIKAAAGFHHLLRDNHKGAVNLLSDSIRLLEPYRPATLGVDVEGLLAGVRRALDRVLELGPERLREFDRSLIPVIQLDTAGVREEATGAA
jgi:predicted metal-dependent hydrolase